MRRRTTAAGLAAAMLFLASCASTGENREVHVFSSYLSAHGKEITEDNEVQELIAEKTGAKVIETWMGDDTNADEVIGKMILEGDYPDYIYATSDSMQKLIKNNALIPIDNYWDDYPYLKGYFTEDECERLRQSDGHIYYIPSFSKYYLKDTSTIHNDEAFWVQVKVLEWAGYPEINTLDDYFKLLEDYVAANPVDENGDPYIAYEIMANETFFFGLDNAPLFLDGYPNDGACKVHADTLTVEDFNISPTAKKWFEKLNEEYKKGIVDQSAFLLSNDDYNSLIKTGRVLGMVDQYWHFSNSVSGLPAECRYIPLGPVIEEGIEEHYHSTPAFDASQGMAISVTCEDPEAAVKFLNDLLSPEILNLRFWGLEGTDYMVGDDGVFYQTEEQYTQWRDTDYAKRHICTYSYFPYYWGMSQDGINAYNSSCQASMFYDRQPDIIKECLDAYGARTYVEMLNPAGENAPWYPMWSYTGTLEEGTDEYRVMNEIEALKREYLPRVVMAEDFEQAWKEYTEEYKKIDTDVYFNCLEEYVQSVAE